MSASNDTPAAAAAAAASQEEEKEESKATSKDCPTASAPPSTCSEKSTETATATAPSEQNGGSASSDAAGEKVDFKVIYNKKKYDVSFPLDGDVGQLKVHLQSQIQIPPAMMKVMIKGLAKDEMTLRQLNVTKGTKVMVVGSSLDDVLKVSTTPAAGASSSSAGADDSSSSSTSSSSREKMHKKVLDKGKPSDVMPGVRGGKEPLPPTPLSGMLNKHGGRVRLTFKLEVDQLWIGTKERTEKLPMNSIKSVVSEKIDGHPDYHIMALQLGPTEASRYWIYWVPAQYVDAIKESILGKWQYY